MENKIKQGLMALYRSNLPFYAKRDNMLLGVEKMSLTTQQAATVICQSEFTFVNKRQLLAALNKKEINQIITSCGGEFFKIPAAIKKYYNE